jgi:hypothetical protein
LWSCITLEGFIIITNIMKCLIPSTKVQVDTLKYTWIILHHCFNLQCFKNAKREKNNDAQYIRKNFGHGSWGYCTTI